MCEEDQILNMAQIIDALRKTKVAYYELYCGDKLVDVIDKDSKQIGDWENRPGWYLKPVLYSEEES